MDLEYQFELVFLRLVLKRNVLSESTLRITLLESSKELEPASTAFQTEELRIRKNQKIIDLDAMKAFSFVARSDHPDNKFTIKYEIKGNSEDRVRSIPINTAKMIHEYTHSKKSIFEETFGGENAEISFKFYITTKQPNYEVFKLLITPESKEENEEAGNETKRSNSISRSKRPPNLNINKRTASPSPPPSQGDSSEYQQPKHPMKHLPSTMGSLLALSPVSPQPNKMPFLALNNLESHEQNSSVSGTHKKISSLPMSEIEKVNELMATHHRPQTQEHHASYLSYKLKIVIVMFIIGIAFLIFDTFSDRKSYNKPHKAKPHAPAHQEDHADHHGHAKTSKKSNPKPSKKQPAKAQGKKKGVAVSGREGRRQ